MRSSKLNHLWVYRLGHLPIGKEIPMSENKIVMVVPNTKEGLSVIKELAKQIVDNKILIRLVTKKEFELGFATTK